MNTFDPSNGAYPAAPQWGPDTGPRGAVPGAQGPASAPTQVGQWAPAPGQPAYGLPSAPQPGMPIAPEAVPTQIGQAAPSPTPAAAQPGVPVAPEAAPTQGGHWAQLGAPTPSYNMSGAPQPGPTVAPEAAPTQGGQWPGSSAGWTAPADAGQGWTSPDAAFAPQEPLDARAAGNLTAGAQYAGMAPAQPHPGASNFGPGTQPFGSPPDNSSPGGGPGKLLAFGAAAMAVVAVGVGVVAVTVSGSDEASASDGSTPSMVSALTTGESPSKAPRSTSARPRSSEPTRAAEIGPIVPGYQPVAVPNRSAAYDVPAGWRVAPEGNVGGFGQPPEAVVGTGLATDGVDYCPGSTRTVAFLTGSDTTDPAKAATDTGTKAATIAYTGSRDVKPGAAQPLTSADGSQQGMLVETTGRLDSAKPGCAAQFSVYTYAVPARTGTIVLVLAADTGVPDAVDPATAKRILSSIRPLKR